MRTYVLETETFPARGGQRRGLSLDCAIAQKPPGDPHTSISLFGMIDMIDPKTNRIQDTAFTVTTWIGGSQDELLPGVASWLFDSQSFYSDITALMGGSVALNTVSETISGDRKKLTLQLVIP